MLTDLEACRNFYRGNTNYPQPATSGTAAADILVALGKFDAELKELREAADARPDSRFPIEYDYEPSWAILLPHLGHLRSIGRIDSIACHRASGVASGGRSVRRFETRFPIWLTQSATNPYSSIRLSGNSS